MPTRRTAEPAPRVWPWLLGLGILALGLGAAITIRDRRLAEQSSGGGMMGLPF